MKRITAWLLACLLIFGASAHALSPEEALEKVSGYLTEVYGYTVEEAEAFQAYAETDGEDTSIVYWPAAHPDWMYLADYDAEQDRVFNAISPFYTQNQYENYPGESAVRMGLAKAREEEWFIRWDEQARQALSEYMAQNGIVPTARLTEGLSLGSIPAGDALHEYFVSCYGDENLWNYALNSWYTEEMESYALSYTGAPAVEKGVTVWQAQPRSGQTLEMTRFIGEIPQQLEKVFAHPKLEGWTCLCGALMEGVENRYAYGLAAFEKGDERLLVTLEREVDSTEWKLFPVSKQALYTDKEMYITPTGKSIRTADIVYQTSATETERFEVRLVSKMDGMTDAAIERYTRMDEATGNGFRLDLNTGVKVTTFENHRKTGEKQAFAGLTATMSMFDVDAFPTAPEEVEGQKQGMIPEGYSLVRGVHLRQKTSSRSKDLGDYNNGVLVKILGTEAGDPDPWYRVQVGRAEGYMSSNYVDTSPDGTELSAPNVSLPFARAQKEISLKKSPGFWSGTVQKVPQGTLMHVLAECDGGWLHVSLPQGEIGWEMDIGGTDGYIRENDVQIAGTPLMLEWMN